MELRRIENRNKKLLKLLVDVSGALKIKIEEIEVLNIADIDHHQILRNSSDFDFNYLNLSFPKDKLNAVKMLLFSLDMGGVGFLSLSHSSDIAIFKMDMHIIINHLDDLILLDGDTINIYDANYLNGITIDLYQAHWHLENELQYLWIYDIRVFGLDWIKKIAQNA